MAGTARRAPAAGTEHSSCPLPARGSSCHHEKPPAKAVAGGNCGEKRHSPQVHLEPSPARVVLTAHTEAGGARLCAWLIFAKCPLSV